MIAVSGKHFAEIVVTEYKNNIGSDYCVHNITITKLFFTEKFALSYTVAFYKNSLSVACCAFGVLEVRTITPNRFKNQSSGTWKILAHNCNHQKGLVKQKAVVLYHCGFKAEFSKHSY